MSINNLAIGIYSWFGYRMPLAERFRMIKEAGFGNVSVWWAEGEENLKADTKRHIVSMISDSGLVLENVHVPFRRCNDLWKEDSQNREDAIARHLTWLEDCSEYSIPAMVMHVVSGSKVPPPGEHLLNSVTRIVSAAEEHGVIVAIENTRRPEYIDFLLSEIDSPNLGLCYDSSHDTLWGSGKAELLARFPSRAAALHLSDTDGRQDRHWIPGDGVADWKSIVTAISNCTNLRSLMLEVYPGKQNKTDTAPSFLHKARIGLEGLLSVY